jgi:hypothetical protein
LGGSIRPLGIRSRQDNFLNGAPVTIVGVVTAKFTGLTMGNAARIFVPLTLQPLVMPRAARIGWEIGIRMALGARMGQILAGVLREALWLSCGGVMVGVGVSLWLAQFIGSMLYGLTAADPATLAFTAELLIAVALLAGLGPARRASRVHPLSALRHQ